MVCVYIAPVTDAPMEPVWPPLRQAQLENTVDEAHRRRRYAVWKLLERGMKKSIGLSMEQLELTLDHRGRWFCKECFFSLSHSKNAVAVAISDAPVGIDIEALARPMHPGLAKKILTDREQAEFAVLEASQKPAWLLQKWCKKESLFKWREAAGQEADSAVSCQTGIVTVAGETYCYGITTQEEIKWN